MKQGSSRIHFVDQTSFLAKSFDLLFGENSSKKCTIVVVVDGSPIKAHFDGNCRVSEFLKSKI